MANHTTGICANCGAWEGLHQSETMRCPKNGIEESRFDKLTGKFYPQRWEETTFQDNGVKKLHDAVPELLKLAEHILAMSDDAYFMDHPEWEEIVNEAKQAINKIE